MMVLVPRCKPRICSRAPKPSSPGIERSIRTTSGENMSARATASSPSRASPTISISRAPLRSALMPSRARDWSSAMSTRIILVPDQFLGHVAEYFGAEIHLAPLDSTNREYQLVRVGAFDNIAPGTAFQGLLEHQRVGMGRDEQDADLVV